MIPLGSKAANKILVYFMMNPDRTHHLRELAHLIDMDPGNLSRELQRLSQSGLLEAQERGRLKIFSLDKRHPLYKELRAIVLKTYGAEPLLREALKKIAGIEQAILYGSYATGEADVTSDIDVLIVGTPDTLQLKSHLGPLERRLGREIHYRILSRSEFDRRIKINDPFLSSALSGEIIHLIDSTS